MTEWVWDRGVSGAVGVVGVWGRLRGGEASGADLDNVMLDTRLSYNTKTDRQTELSYSPNYLCILDTSLTMQVGFN